MYQKKQKVFTLLLSLCLFLSSFNGTFPNFANAQAGFVTISGTVSRPDGANTSGAIDINVVLEMTQQPTSLTQSVTIPDGQQSIPYTISNVPDGPSYKLYYDIQSGTGVLRHGYRKLAYYKENSSPVSNYDEASFIPTSSVDINNLNLILVSAKLISGSISLPNGQVAPTGGYNITMHATHQITMDQSTWVNGDATIPENQNFAGYNIIIDDNLGITDFKVSYGFNIGTIPGYFNWASYSNGTTTPMEKFATSIDLAQGDVSNINLTLVPSKTISGIVALPQGNTAPVGGLQLNINARDDNGTQDPSDDVDSNNCISIPEGQSSAQFSINVLDNHTYKLFFQPQEGSGYVSTQFYSSTGMVLSYDNAGNIPVNGSNVTVPSIEAPTPMVLITSKTISGSITLPTGQTAPDGGLQVQVGAYNNNAKLYYGKWITIAAGTSGNAFSIDVQDGISYSLRAEPQSGKGFISPVYYKDGGSVLSNYDAGVITVSGSSITDKNIELMTGRIVSGTISRSSGTGSFEINLSLQKPMGDKWTNIGNQNLTFAEGEASKTFSLTAPPENDLKLSYHINNTAVGNMTDGYYSINGTKSNINDADTLDTTIDNTGLTFNVAKASTITGYVSLPVGETAQSDLNINVNGWLDNNTPEIKDDDMSVWTNVKILSGQSSAQFNLSIPDGITSTLTMRANVDALAQYASSAQISIPVADGKYTGEDIKLGLNKVQLVGAVYEPGTSTNTVPWTNINIRQKDSKDGFPGVSADDQGNFKIGGLADGIYILTAMTWGTNFTNSADIQITISNSAITESSVPLENGILKIHLTAPQIKGTAVNNDGGNAKGGYIDLWTTSTDPKAGKTFVSGVGINSDGSFSVGGLKPGTYTLRANPSSEDIKGGNTAKEMQVVIDEAGQFVGGPNMQIQFNTPQVTGYITDPAGQNVSDGYVEVTQDNGSYKEWITCVPVMGGVFAFSNLSDGIYIIKAHPGNDSKYSASQDVTIKIDQGVFAGVQNGDSFSMPQGDFVLSLREAQVTGIVKNPDGSAARWGYVDIRLANDQKGNCYGVSFDENGNFNIAGLAPGTYIFVANPDWSTGYTPSAETTVTIGQDGKYTGNAGSPLALNLRTAQVSGTVVNPQGEPECYGWLEVMTGNEKDKKSFGVPVDQDGKFSLGGLGQGEYILTAHPSDGSQYSASGQVVISIDANGKYLGGNLTIALQNPSLTGYIKNPDNSAACYGWVNIETTDGKWISGTGADQNGYFKMGALPAGTYVIRAYPDWMTNYCESDGQTITVDLGGNVTGFNGILTLKNPQLVGTVKGPLGTGEANTAIPYGWVELRKQDGQGGYNWFGGSGVNDNGQFRMGGLADGTYTVIAYPDWKSNYSQSAETTITISGGLYTGGTLTLNMTSAQISGTVKGPVGSADENNAIPYGYAELRKQNGEGWDWLNGVPVDDQGMFKIGGLAAGNYSLKVYPDWNSQYSPSANIEFTIDGSGNCTSGSSLNINLANKQLTGTIKDYLGQNVQYGSVEIRKQNGSGYDWLTNVEIDENGSFKLGGLGDGSYKIMAYPKFGNKISPSGYITLTIAGGEVTTASGTGADLNAGAKTLTINLGAPQISGVIINPSNNPVPYCWVEVRDSNGNFVIGTGTDEQGKYTLSGLANGSYKIKAYPSKDAEFSPSADINVTIAGGSYSGNPLNISLRSAVAIGTVKNQGNAIKKGWVEIYDENNNWVMTLPVDELGHFKLGGLGAGNYTIQAYQITNSGFESSAKKSLVIGNDLSVNYDGAAINEGNPMVISIIAAKITGTVYMPGALTAGNAANGGWVEIGDSNSVWLLNVPVAPDGTFKLPDLANGSYKIQAFNKDYTESVEQDLTVDGNIHTVTLQLQANP